MEMNNTQPPSQVKFFIQGQYAVVDLLGQGASGAVYLVKDERHPQNHFVLKEVMHAVRKERRGYPFDAVVLRRLKHLALPRIYQVFPGDKHDRFYLLMDYIEGSNLEVVQQSVPGQHFSLPEAITLMSPIVDAVSYLHRQRPPLIHGDIKPSNIIVPKAGAPSVLVDFGGVKDLDADPPAPQSRLNYRAPEQYSGGTSPRTDIYALGAVLYTLLTGTVPAAAADRLARRGEKEADPLVPVNQITPYVRPTVARAIHGALSIQSDDRFATVEQFWEVLWQFMTAAQPSWLQVPEPMITPAMEETKTEPDVSPAVAPGPELAEGVPTEDQTEPDVSPVVTQEPELAEEVPAEDHTEPEVNPVVTQVPELDVVVPAEDHTEPDVHPVVTQVPALAEGVPTEDQMGQDAEPDGTMQEREPPVLMVDAPIEAEVASAPASSEPPLSPALAGEDHPAGKGSLHERSAGLRPEKPGLLATGRARSKEKSKGLAPKSPKRKARKFFLFTLLFVLVCVIGAGIAIARYQTYKELKKNTVSGEAHLLYTRT